MSLFQTGFKVDASTPVASTSTTAHPAAGSAHKKRKRENNETIKIDDILNNTINKANAAAASSPQPSSSGPSKKHEEIDISKMLGNGLDNKKQSSSNTAEAVVNIEKLMKRLERMEKAEHEKTTHVNGNKKPKIGNAATDALKDKGKGKDGNAIPLGKDRKAAAVDPSKAKNNQNKKKKKDDSAPKVDYIPDEAALAKREERKLKKEIYATTKKPSTTPKKGEDVTQEQAADESAMHIDVLESGAGPSSPAKASAQDLNEETANDTAPTEEVTEAIPQETKKKLKVKKAADVEKQAVTEQAEPEAKSPVKEDKQVKQKPAMKKEKAFENKAQPPAPAPAPVPAASGSDAGMTDLQKKMQKKLGGARFRWINEQLYTTSGVDALQLMEEDPAMFEDYHNGFASQATSWPSQPIQLFIDYFRKSYSSTSSPKPVIADLGCGKAELAATLVPLGYTVLSYDLVESEPYIVKAQCTKRLPLPGSSDVNRDDSPGAVVDFVVCCLSLMGSDWLGMIQEARRVLKTGGKLKIAEVTSRFEDVKQFTNLITSMGFKLSKKDDSNTHFILLDFEKIPVSTCKSPFLSLSSEAKVAKSQELLKPCIYKRR